MSTHKPYALRVALFFIFLLGAVPAFAQKLQPLTGLPNVNLGLPKPNVGPPTLPIPGPVLPPIAVPTPPPVLPAPTVALPPVAVPPVKVDVEVGLPVVPGNVAVGVDLDAGKLGASVSVPSVGGLTPPLNATVNVNSAGSALQAGVNVGGPGAPPLPEMSLPAGGAPQQVAERRLELLPTCR